MIRSRSESTARPAKVAQYRANPTGLGRLLIMVATVGLITLGQGLLWWAGLVLMGLILLAVGRGKALWGIGSVAAIIIALGFWHLHVIPEWTGLTFVGLAAIQFALSLWPSRSR